MNLQTISKLIEDKLNINSNFIEFSFYELRVSRNMSENDVDIFLKYARTKLENMGYRVYFTNAKYRYNEKNYIVESNKLMIAIKE